MIISKKVITLMTNDLFILAFYCKGIILFNHDTLSLQ